jgi:transposase
VVVELDRVPVRANSGKTTTRFRLDRYGDRQPTGRCVTVALSRLRHDETTQVYAERRTSEEGLLEGSR